MSAISLATVNPAVATAVPKITQNQLASVFLHLTTVMGEKGFKFSAKGYPEKGEIVFSVENEKYRDAFLNELAEMDPVLHEKFPGLHETGVHKIGEPDQHTIKVHLRDEDAHILVKVVLKASSFTRSEGGKLAVGAPQGMSVFGEPSLRNPQKALVLVDETIREVINDPEMKRRLNLEGIENLDLADLDGKILSEFHRTLLEKALKSRTRDDGFLKMSLASVARDFLEKRLS